MSVTLLDTELNVSYWYSDAALQVRHAPVQEAEICLWTAQGQPQDHLQGKLQIWSAGEVSS